MEYFEEQKKSYRKDFEEKQDKLFALWRQLYGFDEETIIINLEELFDDLDEILEDELEAVVLSKIGLGMEIKELKEKAIYLQSLLKIDNWQLPELKSDTPLIVFSMEIEKSVTDLNEILSKREEIICELSLQQDELCEELGDTPRTFPDDHFPDADEIDNFRHHVRALRVERRRRLDTVVALRDNIKKNMQMLKLVPSSVDDRLLNQQPPCLTNESLTLLHNMQKLMSGKIAHHKF